MEFEKLPSSKPTQTRFLRSQQDLKAKHEAKESGGGGEAEGRDSEIPHDNIVHFVCW